MNPAAAPPKGRRGRLLVAGAIGAALALTGVAADAFLAGSDVAEDDERRERRTDLYPNGGNVPAPELTDLREAAEAAGCELRGVKVSSRDHVAGAVSYPSRPPAGGEHSRLPAEDGIYSEAPKTEALVHSLEHGRVLVSFKPRLASDLRAKLKAFYEDDPLQVLLTPDRTGMTYELAASAWNREPEPLGSGRLLGCPRANDRSFDALAAFRDKHRGNGPEAVP